MGTTYNGRVNGQRHRTDGQAIEHAGYKAWWVVSLNEFIIAANGQMNKLYSGN